MKFTIFSGSLLGSMPEMMARKLTVLYTMTSRLLLLTFLCGPVFGANCDDFVEVNDNCPNAGKGRLVPSTCDDPNSLLDDRCAEVFIEWYDRCFATMSASTKTLYGAELTQFDDWCNKTLAIHRTNAREWPVKVMVAADNSELKDWDRHQNFLGAYQKTTST